MQERRALKSALRARRDAPTLRTTSMRIATRAGLCLLIAFAACAAQQATASVQIKFLELDPDSGLSGFKLYNNGSSQTVSAGALLWDTQGDDGNPPALPLFDSGRPYGGDGFDDLYTFCIELGQFAYKSFRTYEKTPVENAPDPYVSSTPTGASIGSQRADLLDLLADNYWTLAFTSDVYAAAFQLAVWEIVHESTTLAPGNPLSQPLELSKTSSDRGTFYVNNSWLSGDREDAVDLANEWLHNINNNSIVHDDNLSLYALSNHYKQDQIYQYIPNMPDDEGTVPEPGSLLVWAGMCLMGLGLITQRDRRS